MRITFEKSVHCALILWSILPIISVYGQPVSLDQLTERALSRNLSVLATQLDEVRAQARIAEVKAGIRPRIDLAGDYRRYLKIPGQVVPASFVGGLEGQYVTFAFGLPYNLSTTLQATQPLYNPLVSVGLRAAKAGQEVATLQTRQVREEVAYQVAVAFYNLQATAQQITFLRNNLISTERLLQVVDLRRQNQLAQRTDVDRLRVGKIAAETQIESLVAAYNEGLSQLKYLTGMPQADTLSVQLTIAEQPPLLVNTIPIETRTDVQLLDRRQMMNQLEQQATKAGFLPTLSAYGVANNTFFAKGGDDGTFKSVPGYWVGLQLNWNVFDGWTRRARLSGQKAEARQLALRLQQVQESLSIAQVNARNKFLVEQQNTAANREQVTLATDVYAQTQLQFKEGATDLTTVIQAENALLEAQTNYLTSLIKLRTAELNWKKASGILLNPAQP